ncbi:MAG: DNA repair protein RecO [Gammaproteobacteria bacterium]|nr:DNA repair protein RecO [Gammaproteobacteria bacterium]
MSTARVDLEPAYVLHARSYRETSLMLEVFTHTHGRIGLIARGARRPKSAMRGLLSPFQPLRLSWSGRGELQTLRDAELAGIAASLTGDQVLSGFYLNELLLKFLQRHDPHTDLFAHYAQTIAELAGASESAGIEPVLRRFELGLLRESGYALNLAEDAITHEPLEPDAWYDFYPDRGAIPRQGEDTGLRFRGAELLAIDAGEFATPATTRAARRLLRAVINTHLGDAGLRTRRVAAAMRR